MIHSLVDTFVEVDRFLAMGAAWGVLWLSVFGLFRPSWVHLELLRFIALIFMVTAGITAFAICYELISEYITSSESEKEQILNRYEGSEGIVFITQLVVIFSPMLLLWKRLFNLKIILAIIAICYVSLPYSSQFIYYLTK